nr:helix-turn-helix transcriptional regulator [Clostridium sp. JN-9]
MIKIHLSRLLGEKRWTQADLARKTNIRPNTISELYNELVDRVSLEQLDKICEVLECDISDLLEYIPNKDKHLKNKRP